MNTGMPELDLTLRLNAPVRRAELKLIEPVIALDDDEAVARPEEVEMN